MFYQWLNRVTCVFCLCAAAPFHSKHTHYIFMFQKVLNETFWIIFFQTVPFSAQRISFRTCPTKRSTPSPTRGKASMKDCGRLRTTPKLSSLHPRYIFLLSVSSIDIFQYLSSRRWLQASTDGTSDPAISPSLTVLLSLVFTFILAIKVCIKWPAKVFLY